MGRFDWILMVVMALVLVFGTAALGAAAHAGVLETQGVVAGDEGRCDYYQGDDCDDDDDDRDDDDRDDGDDRDDDDRDDDDDSPDDGRDDDDRDDD